MSYIHILLVDDEQDFRHSTVKTLARRGFAIDDVGSGAEALDYLQHAMPDLIVLDLKMPEMDGLTTLKHIRARHGDLPVIILTGHGDFDSALSGIKLEIVDFLQKPIDIDELADKIHRLLHSQYAKPLTEPNVADLMVTVDHYESVYEDQPLSLALKKIRTSVDAELAGEASGGGHRSILVLTRDEQVIGLLRMVDVIGMAAPAWMFDDPYCSFYTGMFLAQCKVIGDQAVGNFIDPDDMLAVDEQAPLIEAAVIMAENRLINLPVLRDGKVVGILRDKDLFRQVLHIALGG